MFIDKEAKFTECCSDCEHADICKYTPYADELVAKIPGVMGNIVPSKDSPFLVTLTCIYKKQKVATPRTPFPNGLGTTEKTWFPGEVTCSET